MGFNFGAFAGGLAQGIQKAQELAIQQAKYQQDVNDANNKMKLEEAKAVREAAKFTMDTETKLAEYDDKINKATNVTELNNTITARNNLAKAAANTASVSADSIGSEAVKNEYAKTNFGISSLYAQMNVKDVNGQDKTIIVPEGYANAKDSITLDANGNIAVKTTGQDGRFDGNVVSTNEKPFEFKHIKDMWDKGVEMFRQTPTGQEKQVVYSQDKAKELESSGWSGVQKIKDPTIVMPSNPTEKQTEWVSDNEDRAKQGLPKRSFAEFMKATRMETSSSALTMNEHKAEVEAGLTNDDYTTWRARKIAAGTVAGTGTAIESKIVQQDKALQQITGGKDLSTVNDPKVRENAMRYFNAKQEATKTPNFNDKDMETLKKLGPVTNSFNQLYKPKGGANDVAGFADNVISTIKSFTGIGDNVEDESKAKASLKELEYSMARTMSGSGNLSNTDVVNGAKVIGDTLNSDRALKGKLSKALDETVSGLDDIKNRNPDAFEAYYGPTYRTLKSLQTGIASPKVKTKEEIISGSSNNDFDKMNMEQKKSYINGLDAEARKNFLKTQLKGL